MIEPPRIDLIDPALQSRLARKRALVRLVLWVEILWPALWPAVGVVGLYLCLALLDVPGWLAPWPRAGLLAGVLLVASALAVRGLWHLRLPGPDAADRRLEVASGLTHQPLLVLVDRPAGDAADMTRALWQIHAARAVAQLGRLRAGWPHPGLAAQDRRALRLGLLVALAAVLGVAGREAPDRVRRAFLPDLPALSQAVPVQIHAWITPPAHTGLPPLFLRGQTDLIEVPVGSRIDINLTGGDIVPSLVLPAGEQPFQALDTASFQASAVLTQGGVLAIRRGRQELARWRLDVVADTAPMVRFTEPPEPVQNGQTRLPWMTAHPYGVMELHADLRLAARPDAPALEVAVPLPSARLKAGQGVHLADLTSHPWAGLPVEATLVAQDGAGHQGRSAPASLTLPERRFLHPMARALQSVRRQLALNPAERGQAMVDLLALSGVDDVWQTDIGGLLVLDATIGLLHRDRTAAAIDEAQDRLWLLALRLEEAAPARTAQALDQARQTLKDALDAKADPATLDRLMQAVQDTLRQHLQALYDQAQRDPTARGFDPETDRLDANDLRRMAQEMRDALRQGRPDAAREALAEMDRLLQAMRQPAPPPGQMTPREAQRAEKRREGDQQLNAVSDIAQREAALLDKAQPRAAQGARSAPDHAGEQRTQLALRRALGVLMQRFADLTGEVPANLGDADTAMNEAAAALGRGQDAAAAQAQQRAITALSKGARAMGLQLSRQFGRGQQSGADGEPGEEDGPGQVGDGDPGAAGPGMDRRDPSGRTARGPRDPLGRPVREGGGEVDDGDGGVRLPGDSRARAGALQDTLRQRGGERSRPQPELDYIERLLKQF